MESCEKYLEMISAMMDGELDDDEREALMAHIPECDSCRRALDAFSAIADDMRQLAPLPGNLCGGVMCEIKKPKKKIIHWQRYAALAACLVLVCAAGLRAIPERNDMFAAKSSGNVAMFSLNARELESAPAEAPECSEPDPSELKDEMSVTSETVPKPEYCYGGTAAVSGAESDTASVSDVMLNSVNFDRLFLNSGGVSYEATEDEAKYLLSNLNYGHEAEAPVKAPDITIDLCTGETVELWESDDGIVCRLDGLTFAPAGDPETINSIIDVIIK